MSHDAERTSASLRVPRRASPLDPLVAQRYEQLTVLSETKLERIHRLPDWCTSQPMPDAGENEVDDGKHFPSDLSKSTAIKKTAEGSTYLDPRQFHEYFAADLSAERAGFMARSQVFNAAENFRAVITSNAGTQHEPKATLDLCFQAEGGCNSARNHFVIHKAGTRIPAFFVRPLAGKQEVAQLRGFRESPARERNGIHCHACSTSSVHPREPRRRR